jgi:hypothetical protein
VADWNLVTKFDEKGRSKKEEKRRRQTLKYNFCDSVDPFFRQLAETTDNTAKRKLEMDFSLVAISIRSALGQVNNDFF